jgi:23S rRNA (pseudouridine1915-N3)-methyltransferase
MLLIRLVCVGRLKEKFYIDAAAEYATPVAFLQARNGGAPEARIPQKPSPAQIESALAAESAAIEAKLLKNAALVALCVRGRKRIRRALPGCLATRRGTGRLMFVIGGSHGLHDTIKSRADVKCPCRL